MADSVTSQTQHITSLDFDVTKALQQLQQLQERFNAVTQEIASKNWSINAVVNGDEELNKLENKASELANQINNLENEIKNNNSTVVNSFSQVNQQLENVSGSFSNAKGSVSDYQSGLENTSAATNDLNENTSVLISTIENKLVTVLSQAAQAGYDAIKSTEDSMVEIGRVLNTTASETETLRGSLFDLGNEYGRSFEDVSDVALRFAQAGYDMNDTLSNTKALLLGMNTAELEADSGTTELIGILSQWGMEASELTTVIDKLNYTADNNAITTQDLADALLKASSMAKTAGMSFDDTVGVLTAMKVASGAAGKEVGNAFKSIAAYIQRPDSLKLFESMGIDVFKDEVTGELLPMMEILQNMSDKWNNSQDEMVDALVKSGDAAQMMSEEWAIATGTLDKYNQYQEAAAAATDKANDAESRAQAQAAAGVFRRNYYIALMENFINAVEISDDLINAEGHSAEENSRYMDTLTAKTNQLVVALTELAVAAADSRMLDLAKEAIETATAIVKWTTETKTLIPILSTVGGLLVTIKSQKIADEFSAIGGAFGNAFNALKGGATTLTGIETAASGATVAATGLSSALGAIGLAISAVSAVIGVVTAIKNSMHEARMEAIETAKSASDSVQSLYELYGDYETLRDTVDRTTEQEQEYKNVQDEIVKALGDRAYYLDNLRQGTDEYSKALEQATKAELQNLEVEQMKAIPAAKKELVNNSVATNIEGGAKYRDLSSVAAYLEKEGYADKLSGTHGGYQKVGIDLSGTAIEDYAKLSEIMESLNQRAAELAQTYGNDVATAFLNDDMYVAVEKAYNKISEAGKNYVQVTTELAQTQYILQNGIPKTVEEQEAMEKSILETVDTTGKLKEQILSYVDVLGTVDQKQIDFFKILDNSKYSDAKAALIEMAQAGTLNETTFNSVIHSTSGMTSEIAKLRISTGTCVDYFNALYPAVDKTSNSAENAGEEIGLTDDRLKELAKTISSSESNITSLNKYMETLSEGSGLTAKEVTELCDTYGLLANQFTLTEKGYTIEISALEELRDAQAQTAVTARLEQAGYTEDVIANILKRIQAYSSEIESISTVAEAQVALETLKTQLSDTESNVHIGSPYEAKQFAESRDALRDTINQTEEYANTLEYLDALQNDLYKNLGKSYKETKKETDEADKAFKALVETIERFGEMGVYSTQETIDKFEELRRTAGYTEEQIQTIEDKLHKLYSSQIEEHLKAAEQEKKDYVEKVKEKYEEDKEALKKTLEEEKDAFKEQQSDELDERKKYWSDEIDKLKENLNAQIDASKKAYESKKKLYEKSYDNQKESLESLRDLELENIKESYNAQIDALKKIKAARQAERDDEDYQEERNELLEQISYWEQRTGTEAVENIENLKKQLADLDKEHKRDVEDRELDNKVDDLEDERDKETAAIKARYDEQLAALKTTKEAELEIYETTYNAEQELLKAKLEKDVKAMEDARDADLKTFQKQQKQKLKDLEDEQEKKLKDLEDEKDAAVKAAEDKWKQIEKIFDDSNTAMVASAGIFASDLYDQFNQEFTKNFEMDLEHLKYLISELNARKPSMEGMSGTMPTTPYSKGSSSGSSSQSNGNDSSGSSSSGGTSKKKKKTDVVGASTGGKTTADGMVMLHKNELIINPPTTKKLEDLIESLAMPKTSVVIDPSIIRRINKSAEFFHSPRGNSYSTNNNYSNSYDNSRPIVQNFNAPLQNIEKIEDAADMEAATNALERKIMREVSTKL